MLKSSLQHAQSSSLQHAQVPLHKHSTVHVLTLTLRVRQCYVMCAVSVEASGNGGLVGLRSSGSHHAQGGDLAWYQVNSDHQLPKQVSEYMTGIIGLK